MTLNLNKKNNPKNKLFINIALFFVLLIVSFYFILVPTINKIKKLRIEIANTKIEINKTLEENKNIGNQTSKLKTIENQIETLNKVFINRNRELEFITTLEGVATKNNVEQNFDLKNIPDSQKDEFLTIPLLIKVTGNFDNVMNYLTDLETLAYYINVNEISINKSNSQRRTALEENQTTNTKEQTTITMNITANTYFE